MRKYILISMLPFLSCQKDATIVETKYNVEGQCETRMTSVYPGEKLYCGVSYTDKGKCYKDWKVVSTFDVCSWCNKYDIDGRYNLKNASGTPQSSLIRNGPCESEILPTPSIVNLITATVVGNNLQITWAPAKRDAGLSENASRSSKVSGYQIAYSKSPIEVAFFYRAEFNSNDGGLINVTAKNNFGGSNETYTIPISSEGDYNLKIRAYNSYSSGGSKEDGDISNNLTFKIAATVNAVFQPSSIPFVGVEMMSVTLSNSSNSQNLISTKLYYNSTQLTSWVDNLNNKRLYFIPPSIPLGTQQLILRATDWGTSGNSINLPSIPVLSTDKNEMVRTNFIANAIYFENIFGEAQFQLSQKSGGGTPAEQKEIFLNLLDNLTHAIEATSSKHFQIIELPGTLIENAYLAESKNFSNKLELMMENYCSGSSAKCPEIPSPLVKYSLNQPEFGSPSYLNDIKEIMISKKEPFFYDLAGQVKIIVLDAGLTTVETYQNTTTGKVLRDIQNANATAKLIVNGALFNYVKKVQGQIIYSEYNTMGLVFRNGSVLSTSCKLSETEPDTKLSCQLASRRYWFGQDIAGSFVHGGRTGNSKNGGHPPWPPKPTSSGKPLYNGLGGLFLFIDNRNPNTGIETSSSRIVTEAEDHDIHTYTKLIGGIFGFGAIGYDKATNLLIIAQKAHQKRYSFIRFQENLLSTGIDWAVGLDGGSSTAMAYQDKGIWYFPIEKSKRHDPNNRPNQLETVTNYLIFKQ